MRRQVVAFSILAALGCDGTTPSEPEPLRNQIVFVSDRLGFSVFRPFTMNVDGSGVRVLSIPRGEEVDDPAVSPDGLWIAYRSLGDIWVVRVDGKGQQNLTASSSFDANPVWSHDGKRLAFVTNRDGDNEVYVMNADGSGLRNLTNHPDADVRPTWASDDTRIAFATTRDGNSSIYIANVDGPAQTPFLDADGDDGSPTWSPDGTQIAFISGRAGGE